MRTFIQLFTAIFVSLFTARATAQDTTLADILIDGEPWQQVAEGFKFTEGPAVDSTGTLYFSDVPGSRIYRLDDAGQPQLFAENTGNTNGLMFGPDGKLYGCQFGKKRIVAFDDKGNQSEVASGVSPNDLVVTRDGDIYFTDPDTREVWLVPRVGEKFGEKKVVDRGIARPNGIILWPGQGTLVVADTLGEHLWCFRIEADGTLDHKERYYQMLTPPDRTSSGADGMTVDTKGRVYVATYLGVQVFDTQGRLAGIIAKPQREFLSNVCFAGAKLDVLYATSADKLYCRKTKATGVRFFDSVESGSERNADEK